MLPCPPEQLSPLLDRLDLHRADRAEILRRHEQAIFTRAPQYVDPRTRSLVFTAVALWSRGTCCDSGCRHCPFRNGERSNP